MNCAWCGTPLGYIHGHAACLDGRCPMFGLNQAECCDGETAGSGPLPASTVRSARPAGLAPTRPAAGETPAAGQDHPAT